MAEGGTREQVVALRARIARLERRLINLEAFVEAFSSATAENADTVTKVLAQMTRGRLDA